MNPTYKHKGNELFQRVYHFIDIYTWHFIYRKSFCTKLYITYSRHSLFSANEEEFGAVTNIIVVWQPQNVSRDHNIFCSKNNNLLQNANQLNSVR